MKAVTRRNALFIGAALLGSGLSGIAAAGEGSVEVKILSAGFIVGATKGEGVLLFNGQQYPFSIGGIAAGGFGAAEADLVGTASNLQDPRDIEGVYSALSAGAAVGGGASLAELKNARGVVLRLRGRVEGFRLGVSLAGAHDYVEMTARSRATSGLAAVRVSG